MSGVQKDFILFFLKEGEKGIILLMLLVSKFCYIYTCRYTNYCILHHQLLLNKKIKKWKVSLYTKWAI